jgi:hypothetical protein
MKAKRRIIDAGMVILLPALMAYSLVGEMFHEIAGTLMLLLFLLHHWMNRAWLQNLFRGRYTAQRIFQTMLNLLLLMIMIALPLSGILMSKHLFAFLPTVNLASVARAIHLPLANWGLVLMSLHAGTHLGAMLPKGRGRTALLTVLSAVSAYGIYAFIKRQIPAYMFLKLPFVFFDFSEPIIFFLLDYFAVIVLFATAGYGMMTLLRNNKH